MSHAKLFSPSKAEGWFACPGRAVMEAPFPDTGGQHSADGTARHWVCASVLMEDSEPGKRLQVADFVDRVFSVAGEIREVSEDYLFLGPTSANARRVHYSEDWADEDQDYVDTVRALAGDEWGMFVEQRVNFEQYTGVKDDSFGTADALVFKTLADGTTELIVVDRKTGWHEVPVERNKQLMLYALGAYDEFGMIYEISRVRLVIHQRSAREWDCSVAELMEFGAEVRMRALAVSAAVGSHGVASQSDWENEFLNPDPSEAACAHCKAMATCPSMQRKVQRTAGADFEVIAQGGGFEVSAVNNLVRDDQLAQAMAAVDVIEDWIHAVRAEVERRLLAGQAVHGYKLVLGKAGARTWKDADAAEAALKSMRLKVEEMYDLKVISPTSAEKLAKAKAKGDEKPLIGPRQWAKLQEHITRAPPKPSVAPAMDKRDTYVPPNAADDFEPLAEETAEDLA